MPLQNRVTPTGQLEAVNARGTWLGNRGILHDSNRQIVAPWRHKAWVTCTLDFRGIRRAIFGPNSYSELFFLDEATAFSAGHRPCAACRRDRYLAFKSAWCAANPGFAGTNPSIARIDGQLHAERAIRGGGKVIYDERFHHLPPGTFIEFEGAPHLLWHGQLHPWSHHGYGPPRPALPASAHVRVCTPASIVALFRSGFTPQVHESARLYTRIA
jgi:hypothetical protein